MLFLFNLIYAATWGTVAFLLPTEIFPSEMRAQGNGFGITGWAIGVGWTTLVNPIIFSSLEVSFSERKEMLLLLTTWAESGLLLVRGLELHLDSGNIPLLSRNERSIARIDRVNVPDIAFLLADGESICCIGAGAEITERASSRGHARQERRLRFS